MAERSLAKKAEIGMYVVDTVGVLATGMIAVFAPYHTAAVGAALMGGVTGHFIGKAAERFKGEDK
jgi:hypothetical protein